MTAEERTILKAARDAAVRDRHRATFGARWYLRVERQLVSDRDRLHRDLQKATA